MKSKRDHINETFLKLYCAALEGYCASSDVRNPSAMALRTALHATGDAWFFMEEGSVMVVCPKCGKSQQHVWTGVVWNCADCGEESSGKSNGMGSPPYDDSYHMETQWMRERQLREKPETSASVEVDGGEEVKP